MKIAYIDVNESDCIEDYHVAPKKYGGGRIIAAALLNQLDDFHIYGDEKCFDGIPIEKRKQGHFLCERERQAIKNGAPLKNYIPNSDEYDIFFHHFAATYLNLQGCRSQKQVVWPVGWREIVHPYHKHVLLFDIKNQEPQLTSNHKVYNIVIGPKFPVFQEYPKEDMIFQCSRHCRAYHSIEVAYYALKHEITTVFAGPIDKDYPLLNFINNKITYYLGVIDQKTKEDFMKRAKVNTQFQDYNISVTLAAKEAASYGCTIFATKMGGYKNFIKDGVNGFFIFSDMDFCNSWNKLDDIKQINCYNEALQFSEDKMVESVLSALNDIYRE